MHNLRTYTSRVHSRHVTAQTLEFVFLFFCLSKFPLRPEFRWELNVPERAHTFSHSLILEEKGQPHKNKKDYLRSKKMLSRDGEDATHASGSNHRNLQTLTRYLADSPANPMCWPVMSIYPYERTPSPDIVSPFFNFWA